MIQCRQAEQCTCTLSHESGRCAGRLILWPLCKLAATKIASCQLRCIVCLAAPAKISLLLG